MKTEATYTINQALDAFETLEAHFAAIRETFEASRSQRGIADGWKKSDSYPEFHERMIGSPEMFEKLIGIAHALGDPM